MIGYFRPFEVVVVASKIQSALEGHCNRCSLEIACSLTSGFQHSAALAQLEVLLANQPHRHICKLRKWSHKIKQRKHITLVEVDIDIN